jgi:transglycosylase-like protein with SLT domain
LEEPPGPLTDEPTASSHAARSGIAGRLAGWLLAAKLAVACAGALAVMFAALALLGALIGVVTSGPGAACDTAGSIGAAGVPADLAPLYTDAAARFRLGARGPSVLAAINGVETRFGQNLATSGAGAVGWMQFEPGTWARYGIDANNDGTRNPWEPGDAIFGAANYLRASGAPADWPRAVFAYNHSAAYVQQVLGKAAQFENLGLGGTGQPCSAVPPGDAGGTYRALVAEADRISRKDFPYVWGGGHTQPAPDPDHTSGYDCSGAVSRLVQAAGYPYPTATTEEMEALWRLPRGPGLVTVYLKPAGPSAHVFVRIADRYWGTSGFARPHGGAGWFTESPSRRYLSGFRTYHLPRLGAG